MRSGPIHFQNVKYLEASCVSQLESSHKVQKRERHPVLLFIAAVMNTKTAGNFGKKSLIAQGQSLCQVHMLFFGHWLLILLISIIEPHTLYTCQESRPVEQSQANQLLTH